MADGDKRQEVPVIRIIKKGRHKGHHGGAWKVAYADFVTAMMALFIVLWILGQSPQLQKSVAGYFRDPLGHGKMGAGPLNAGHPTGSESRESKPTENPIATLEREANQLRTLIEVKPDLKALAEQISVEVTPEGLRVEINESEKQPLFESGSAKLSPKLAGALQSFAREFAKLNNSLIIEGHTDSAPFSPRSGMTNWELSTQRATEARRWMIEGGLPDNNLYMVRGFADRKPRFDDPKDPRNRRISVLLLSPEGLQIAMGQNNPSVSGAITPINLPDRAVSHSSLGELP